MNSMQQAIRKYFAKWPVMVAIFSLSTLVAATSLQHVDQKQNGRVKVVSSESLFQDECEAIWDDAKSIAKGGDYPKAIVMMQKLEAECVRKNFRNTTIYTELLRRLSKLLFHEGRFDEALNHLLEAEVIASKLNDLKEEYRVVFAITGGYYQSDDFVKSKEYSYRMLKLMHQLDASDNSELSKAHYLLGSSYRALDQLDSCKHHYLLALKKWDYEDNDVRPQLAAIYETLGTAAWEAKDDASAIQYFKQAAEIQMKNTANSTDGLNLNTNEAALASYYSEKQSREKTLGANNPYTVGCNNYIARALMLTGNYEEALKTCNDALAAYCTGFIPSSNFDNSFNEKDASSYGLLFDLLNVRGKILRALSLDGNPMATDALIQNNRKAIETIDLLRNSMHSDPSSSYWSERAIPFFEFAILSLLNSKDYIQKPELHQEAFDYAERSRAFLLNKAMALHSNQQIAGVPQEVTDSLHQLRAQLKQLDYYTQSIATKCDPDEAKKLSLCRQQILAANNTLELYINEIKIKYPDFYQLMFANGAISLKGVQRHLNESDLLLEYFAGDTTLVVFAIRKNDVYTQVIAHKGKWQNQLNNLLTQLKMKGDTEMPAKEFAQHAFELYQVLVLPFLKEGDKNLRIVADGMLAYLPFEALVVDPDNGANKFATLNYLIKKMTVSYLFSASQLNQEAEHNAGSYIGFAPVYTYANDTAKALRGKSMASLKYNVREVETMQQSFGGEIFSSTELSESIFGLYATDASVLHLAMHTQLQEDDPLASGFVFSQDSVGEHDGILQLHEMYALQLNAQLAILSSCNTAAGRTQRGEGVMSLARAFTYAGCPAVATTLWSCDDESTFNIVSSFGGYWKNGMEKHKALQSAKLDYLKNTDEVHAHPFYWAGMVLCGDTAQYNASNAIWWWCCGGLLALVLSLFLWKRFR